MDTISVLTSFNKISLVAFFITLGFIIYEIKLFKQEAIKETKPLIPDFKENQSSNLPNATKVVVVEENKEFFNKPSRLPLFIAVIFLLFFGAIFLLSVVRPQLQKNSSSNLALTPIITYTSSKGIKVFDNGWVELSEQELHQLKEGQDIIIGIDTLKDLDIDKARIRVNNTQWLSEDVTEDLNSLYNVYYKGYTVSTGESSLKIDAQLHSKTDGWLGE